MNANKLVLFTMCLASTAGAAVLFGANDDANAFKAILEQQKAAVGQHLATSEQAQEVAPATFEAETVKLDPDAAGWLGWNLSQVGHRYRVLNEPPAVATQFLVGVQYAGTAGPQPPRNWRLLGARGVRRISLSRQATPADVDLMRRLFPEAVVSIARSGASDTAVGVFDQNRPMPNSGRQLRKSPQP